MAAEGTAAKHIVITKKQSATVFQSCGVDSLAKIRRANIEPWIANEVKSKIRSPRTINCYIISIKSFAQYLTDIGVFVNHPLKQIRKLNVELDRRKIRRAMTKEEIERLL
jgi:site-specific recombinase XerD